MKKIIIAYRTDMWRDRQVESYPRSYARILRELGYQVREIGEGHSTAHLEYVNQSDYDLFLEIENGRSEKGKLRFQLTQNECRIPSAVVLIDALDLNTPIPTTEGWRTVGDIMPGDYVYGPKGNPVRVWHTTPVFFNRKCYEITFDGGEKIVADAGHRWKVEDTGPHDCFRYQYENYGPIEEIKTTEELYHDQSNDNYFRFRIPVCAPLMSNNSITLDPYILGLWLGDGSKHSPTITNIDEDVIKAMEALYSTRRVLSKGQFRNSYYLGKSKLDNISLHSRLRELNLFSNKHIPNIYLQSSYENRLNLLRGLLDTDGECAKDGQIYFHNSDKGLINQTQQLIGSLGLHSNVCKHIRPPTGFRRDYSAMYRISFRVPKNKFSAFQIKRKLNRQPEKTIKFVHANYHRIRSIRSIESVPVKCISVESNEKLFLVGNTCITTHNSHGHPDIHREVAKLYDHVFFAVWSKRDLFTDLSSAYFMPSATDLKWFDYKNFPPISEFDFGFFSSKGGLSRAAPLKDLCKDNGWSYAIEQVGKNYRHRWPQTGVKMSSCRYLFNHGQKHDINQRIFESMAIKKPLINNYDERSGMQHMFTEGKHYIGYESYTYADLEEKCKWVMSHPKEAAEIAERAYNEVCSKHLIQHRIQFMLEVINK